MDKKIIKELIKEVMETFKLDKKTKTYLLLITIFIIISFIYAVVIKDFVYCLYSINSLIFTLIIYVEEKRIKMYVKSIRKGV